MPANKISRKKLLEYSDFQYPFCLISPAMYAGVLKQPMGRLCAVWKGLGKMLVFKLDDSSVCLNYLTASHGMTFIHWHWGKKTIARRNILHFSHVQIISVCGLILISLSNLGSKILGLYIYGCLYLRDGDQGRSFSKKKCLCPLSDPRSSISGNLQKEGGARQSFLGCLGGVGDEKALNQEQHSKVANAQQMLLCSCLPNFFQSHISCRKIRISLVAVVV